MAIVGYGLMAVFLAIFWLVPMCINEVFKWLTRLFWAEGYPIAIFGFAFWFASKVWFIPVVFFNALAEVGLGQKFTFTGQDHPGTKEINPKDLQYKT